MRKQQYIATVACLVAGVIGFVSVYATDKGKERREAEQEIAAQTQQEAPASYEVKPETSVEDATKKAEEQALKLAEQEKMEQEETQQEQGKKQDEEKTAETAAAVTLHFDKSSAVWPIEGDVLLDYSMDSTIYFPTLEQYRCNPAMVIGGMGDGSCGTGASWMCIGGICWNPAVTFCCGKIIKKWSAKGTLFTLHFCFQTKTVYFAFISAMS